MNSRIEKEFLQGINDIEPELLKLFFTKYSYLEKGPAYYVEYINTNNSTVEYQFGAPEWNIDIIIRTNKGKFSFGDLLGIPEILNWVNKNRYIEINNRSLTNELLWFVELLKISLPLIE